MKCAIAIFVVILFINGSCTWEPEPIADPVYGKGGQTQWVEVPEGRLKTEVYPSANLSVHPTLMIVLHGDLPNPRPSYQYALAQAITQGVEAVAMPDTMRTRLVEGVHVDDVVGVGVLRPGYTDGNGDRSDGVMGMAALDNFTPEVVDDLATTVSKLKSQYRARRVVLVGHSGGAAIAANILGRYPGFVDAALLIACSCDPKGSREKTSKIKSHPMWQGPTRSLQPFESANQVSPTTRVVMVVGEQDEMPLADSHRYADLLRKSGVDVRVTVIPGAGHNIVFYPTVLEELRQLLSEQRVPE